MIDHLSYSSISTYLACAKAWHYRYVQKIETPTSPELVFGTAVHGTIEAEIAHRALGNTQKPDLLSQWAYQWNKATEGKPVDWGMDTPEHFCNEGVRILSHPDVQRAIGDLEAGTDAEGPKIEREVTLSVPGVPVPIIGYIDMIDGTGTPYDFKTSARSWSADKAQSELQPLFYLAALNQAGIRVPNWAFRHVVFVKTKTPQVQIFEHRHSPVQAMWLFLVIRNVWRAIEAECFGENPTGWKCSPQYCDYWRMCRGKYG